ncbi:MAG: MBL fold metallo-hydrolase, partial [Oscillospiraceae bacterium]|nr:MBL fold metallo-hydrolase [Oscillospiraceae bacterium]
MIILIAIIGGAIAVDYLGWENITSYLGLSENAPPRVTRPAEGVVQVHFIDVGQGNAALIISETSAVLIDTGDRQYADGVVDYIRRSGLARDRLCMIIATHPHADHIGGMDRVIDEIGADYLMKPQIAEAYLPDTATFERKMYALENSDTQPLFAEAGSVYPLSESGCTYIEVLAPYDCFGDSINNHSVVVRLVHGENAFLFTGDMERAAEDDLLYRKADLSANVLSVSHHGSRTSSGRGFLEA